MSPCFCSTAVAAYAPSSPKAFATAFNQADPVYIDMICNPQRKINARERSCVGKTCPSYTPRSGTKAMGTHTKFSSHTKFSFKNGGKTLSVEILLLHRQQRTLASVCVEV